MRDPNRLFAGNHISSVVEAHERKMLDAVGALSSVEVLNANPEQWCDNFEEEYRIHVPRLHDEISMDYGEADVDVRGNFDYHVRDTSRPAYVKGTGVSFFVGFEGDKNLFQCRPSSCSLGPPRAAVAENQLVLTYTRTDHDGAAIKATFQRDLSEIKGSLERLRSDVAPFNEALRAKVKSRLESRRQKFLADQGLAASLGFPLQRRADAPQTYTVPLVRRKPPVRPATSSSAAYTPEPEVDLAEYDQILSVISNMVGVMERSPHAFRTLGEEDLRWHFLFQLNGHYEGQATGETFNFQGKTDILIRAAGKNVFVAECKFWDGPKSFSDAIDQLLGYTAWRDTKTALLVFNRAKNFTAVLEKIPSLVKAHSNFRRVLHYSSATASRYALHHRDDPARELILTVLPFEVPV